MLDLGLVLQYLVTPDSPASARESVLGPYVGWPFQRRAGSQRSSYLLILLLIGALLALLQHGRAAGISALAAQVCVAGFRRAAACHS